MATVAGLVIHIVVYAVVNTVLVLIWLLTGHTTEELNLVQDDPLQAVRDGFWPLYVMVAWGAALVIHAGIWLALTMFGGKNRRHRQDDRYHHLHHHDLPVAPMPPMLPGGVPVPAAHDFARQATKAAVGLVESLANRVSTPRPPSPAESRAAAGGRRWVAVMFTDIVGSTGLTETLGDEPWMKLLSEHRAMVRACLVEHRGTEVGTQGDGFLVRFDTPGDAVACATTIQHTLAEGRRTGTFAVNVRIGVHAGEAVEGDNDLIGRVINLASRVTAAAEPGEILVTEPVADHLPPGIVLLDRGLKPLKGIAQPRHLLAVAWGERQGEVDGEPEDATIVLDEEHT